MAVHNAYVYTGSVPTKNVTLSADADELEQARAYMRSQDRTLNDVFRELVTDLSSKYRVKAFHEFLDKTQGSIVSNGPYMRDEMNERR